MCLGSDVFLVSANQEKKHTTGQCRVADKARLLHQRGKSVAQICDPLLQSVFIAYGKEGAGYLRRILARRNDQLQDR
jgi:hypothetical protein